MLLVCLDRYGLTLACGCSRPEGLYRGTAWHRGHRICCGLVSCGVPGLPTFPRCFAAIAGAGRCIWVKPRRMLLHPVEASCKVREMTLWRPVRTYRPIRRLAAIRASVKRKRNRLLVLQER